MTLTLRLVLFALTACLTASAGDWIQLFDGKTLNGWEQKNGKAVYTVEHGAIVGRTAEGSVNSFLCTTRLFGDFELEFDVKVDDKLNSGIMIRASTKERSTGEGANNAKGRVYGPQVEIEASGEKGAEAGYIYGEATGRGWLTPQERLIPHKKFHDGKWNHFRVVAKGPRIQTWINGEKVDDLVDEAIYETHPRGFLGLQVHRIPPGAGPYEAAWRNLRLRELD
ncbi:MAG: DUF1080 domain-containing protein [Acidobacteria bacterium]|nr:DUF1080 domain-containing protein [Acidobacteriota bacterium]